MTVRSQSSWTLLGRKKPEGGRCWWYVDKGHNACRVSSSAFGGLRNPTYGFFYGPRNPNLGPRTSRRRQDSNARTVGFPLVACSNGDIPPMTLPSLIIPPLENLRKLAGQFQLTLGSGSPRRRDFLQKAGLPFEIKTAEISETIDGGESPDKAAERLAQEKAQAVSLSVDDGLRRVIIGADTIVWHNQRALGKPTDEADAYRLLSLLSGQTHTVHSGVALALAEGQKIIARVAASDKTDVTFHSLSEQQITDYIATGDPLDKAGAYGAQELGSFLVDHINGSLDTVIGFPLALVDRLAERLLDQLDRLG